MVFWFAPLIVPIIILYLLLGGAGAYTIISNAKIIAIIIGMVIALYIIKKL